MRQQTEPALGLLSDLSGRACSVLVVRHSNEELDGQRCGHRRDAGASDGALLIQRAIFLRLKEYQTSNGKYSYSMQRENNWQGANE